MLAFRLDKYQRPAGFFSTISWKNRAIGYLREYFLSNMP